MKNSQKSRMLTVGAAAYLVLLTLTLAFASSTFAGLVGICGAIALAMVALHLPQHREARTGQHPPKL